MEYIKGFTFGWGAKQGDFKKSEAKESSLQGAQCLIKLLTSFSPTSRLIMMAPGHEIWNFGLQLEAMRNERSGLLSNRRYISPESYSILLRKLAAQGKTHGLLPNHVVGRAFPNGVLPGVGGFSTLLSVSWVLTQC